MVAGRLSLAASAHLKHKLKVFILNLKIEQFSFGQLVCFTGIHIQTN